MILLLMIALTSISIFAQTDNGIEHKLIFPLQDQHVHGSSIVELPNGDLLSCWFQGSGERKANCHFPSLIKQTGWSLKILWITRQQGLLMIKTTSNR